MSLIVPKVNRFAFTYDNWGANPGNVPGTSFAPGASNVYGNWTRLHTNSSDISTEIWMAEFSLLGGSTSGQDKSQLLDIGVDPAGGTSYVSIFGDTAAAGAAATKAMVFGHSPTVGNSGPSSIVMLPLRIPSGSTVAARVQGSNATAGTVYVCMRLFGKPSLPEMFPRGHVAEIIGAITNSGGVSFTPGNAADGDWTSLGTTVRALFWFQLCVQLSLDTQNARYYWFELAYGDGTNYVTILKESRWTGGSESQQRGAAGSELFQSYCHVPAGATLYVRGRCNAAPDAGWNSVAVGVG
jgi:hypothetical protein